MPKTLDVAWKGGWASVEGDGVAQLFEEPLGDLLGLAGQASDLPQDGFLLWRQVLGNHHLDDHVLVASPPAADVRHAAASQAERLAVLGSRRDGDLDQPFEGRDLDAVPKGRLDHVHAQLVDHVLVVPGEMLVRLDAQGGVAAGRRPPAPPGLSLPAQPYLRPGVDTGRDLDRELDRPLQPTLPTTLRTRVLEQPARAPAGGAGAGGDHRAEDRLGLSADLARAPACRTCLIAGARLGSHA